MRGVRRLATTRALLGALLLMVPGARPQAAPPAEAAATGPIAIDREQALAALARPDRLAGQLWVASPGAEAIKARARGETVEGPPPPEGLELRGVKPGGWPHRLGLRTGDVLQRLDGTDIDGLPTLIAVALRLRARLAGEPGWTFDALILRDGRPSTLRYTVEGPPPSGPPKPEPKAPEARPEE